MSEKDDFLTNRSLNVKLGEFVAFTQGSIARIERNQEKLEDRLEKNTIGLEAELEKKANTIFRVIDTNKAEIKRAEIGRAEIHGELIALSRTISANLEMLRKDLRNVQKIADTLESKQTILESKLELAESKLNWAIAIAVFGLTSMVTIWAANGFGLFEGRQKEAAVLEKKFE